MHDFVVVGGGTAGCVLAERLSRSGRYRVLLIEAGGKPSSLFVRMPAGFAKLFRSKLDWAFESEPQVAAGGRRIFTPRGKMLGGSSNMNAQIHQWCHPADFDGWEAAGATDWSWQDVAGVFRDQERWCGERGERPRGHDGPMPIAPNRQAHALSKAFVAAARAAGIDGPADYNGGAYEGAWLTQVAQRDGRRFSAYNAYLEPAMRRANVEVLTHAQVTRIVIENGRAVGVAVRRGEAEQVYRAGCGVVSCAGAFGSPQLLMLSGIGPANELRHWGITVQLDAPEVGANLQDHPMAPMTFQTRGTDTMRSAESPRNLLRYLLFKRGMLASNAIEAFAFARVRASVDAPDLELIFTPLEWREQGLEPARIDAFSIASAVVAPCSRGRVSLKSADPRVPPAIDFGLLSDAGGVDAAVLLAGVRLIRRIVAMPPLAAFVVEESFPGAAIDGDDELRARLHPQLQTVYHPTSTCRMGSDPGAVVDPQLQVRGVERLWIADASVMPSVPRGHPNAVVAMVAQRAASFMERANVRC